MGTKLPKEFESRAVVHGGVAVLPPGVALEFVRDCRKRRLELVAVEGFRLLPNEGIQPDMANSLMLFREMYEPWTLDQQFDAVEQFLEARLGADLFFDVITL